MDIATNTSIFDTLLEETKTGFSAVVALVQAHDQRVRQAQERIQQLESQVAELQLRIQQVSPDATDEA